jgi:hypothetical protein
MTKKQRDREYNPNSLYSNDVEDELHDMMDFLGETQAPVQPDFDDASLIGDIDITELQWIELESRKADRIGTTDVSLWAPDERGWHSVVDCDNKYLVVFGGFRYRKTGVPAPFKSLPSPDEIEVLNDLRIYDIENVSWHAVLDIPVKKRSGAQHDSTNPNSESPLPPPRFGHVAWYMGESRMMVHGGRGERGRLFCDTWLYYMLENRWELVSNNELIDSPVPSPRFFSSCVGVILREKSLSGVETINTNVYLFGGTDGTDNFGDLWIFRGHTDSSEMMWERQIAVGVPPCPRYGHRFVPVSADGSVLAVLGGCYVSAQSEMVGGNINPAQHKMLQEQANSLQNRYEDENAYARVGGDSLDASVQGLADGRNNAIDGVFRQAAGISSTFHSLELETR